jgi:hypothetical protein
MTRLRLPLFAAMLVLLAATRVATAAETAVPPAFASRDQLRHCLQADSGLKTRAAAIAASDKALAQLAGQVKAEAAQLRALRRKIDREGDGDTAVETFNALARKHNVHVRKLNKDTAAARPASQAYKLDKASYDQTCGAQVYRAEDMDAVTRERAKAASAP